MAFPHAIAVQDLSAALTDSQWDGLIIVSDGLTSQSLPGLAQALTAHQQLDARVGTDTLLLAWDQAPSGRVIHASTGPLGRDYDDVRRVFDAAASAASVANSAGMTKPLLVVELQNQDDKYTNATEVAYLGMCQALWQPLEAREALGEDSIETVTTIGIAGLASDVERLNAMEAGKRIARDLCGTEPERMAPPAFADYCAQAFADTCVNVQVKSDLAAMEKDYPLLYAVARASVGVERHQPRVIRLEYVPEGEVTKTLMIAGKGITFDTGGADLKVGGHMAGMSRDKGGAAAVAGFMYALALIKPPGIKVVAELGAVRNSIGIEAYVPDEIITGHAGKRVRVGNTDAEGRMVLADMLSHLREQALEEVAPELFTVATLTGHAAIACGPYTALVENGPARTSGVGKGIIEAGELWGDPADASRSRREDFDFVQPRTKADDVLSSNNAPSVSTVRGHQFPMAFLTIAAGLEGHGSDSEQPLPFTHVDIAGSGVERGDWQHGKPTAAPVLALLNSYLPG